MAKIAKRVMDELEENMEEVIDNGMQEVGESQEEVVIPEPEVVVNDVPQEKPEPKVEANPMEKVTPNLNFRTYVGTAYYDGISGKTMLVPVGVAFALKEKGLVR